MDAQPGVRRAVTVPTRFQPGGQSPNAREATLYAHLGAKVIRFSVNAASPTLAKKPQAWYSPEIEGTLPWRVDTEQHVAAGPLRIYKVEGSVYFIQCGNVLLQVLPRSQCWCVDGQSRFAMRIQNDIYRIELPFDTQSDKQLVEEMKEALDKVLKYEKTACPFRRGFTVAMPEQPESPVPRGPKWSHIKNRKIRSAAGVQAAQSGEEGDSLSPAVEDVDPRASDEDEQRVSAMRNTPRRKMEGQSSEESLYQDTNEIGRRVATTPAHLIIKDLNQRAETGLEGEIRPKPVSSSRGLSPASSFGEAKSARNARNISPGSSASDTKSSMNIRELSPGSSMDEATFKVDEQRAAKAAKSMLNKDEEAEEIAKYSAEEDLEVAAIQSLPSQDIAPEPSTRSLAIPLSNGGGKSLQPKPSFMEITSDNDPFLDEVSNTDSVNHDAAATLEPDNDATDATTQSQSPPLESPSAATSTTRPSTSPTTTSPTFASRARPRRRSVNSLRHARSTEHLQPGLISSSLALFLGPPSGLISVMVQIARQVARYSGVARAYRFDLGAEDTLSGSWMRRVYRLPGMWPGEDGDGEDDRDASAQVAGYESDGEEPLSEDEIDSEDLDDFGVPLA